LFKWLLFDCLRFKIHDFGGLLAIGYWLLAAFWQMQAHGLFMELPEARGQRPELSYYCFCCHLGFLKIQRLYLTTDFTDFYGLVFGNFGVASSRFVRMGWRFCSHLGLQGGL
jgi:hypothetical protein